MNLSINVVNKEFIGRHWNSVVDLLQSGLNYSEGEITIDQLKHILYMGQAFLIVGIDVETDRVAGVMAVQVSQYPNLRAAHIISYGGYDLFATDEQFQEVVSVLKRAGIERLEGWCKPAQARLFKQKYGFETPYQLITYRIGE